MKKLVTMLVLLLFLVSCSTTASSEVIESSTAPEAISSFDLTPNNEVTVSDLGLSSLVALAEQKTDEDNHIVNDTFPVIMYGFDFYPEEGNFMYYASGYYNDTTATIAELSGLFTLDNNILSLTFMWYPNPDDTVNFETTECVLLLEKGAINNNEEVRILFEIISGELPFVTQNCSVTTGTFVDYTYLAKYIEENPEYSDTYLDNY